MDRMAILIPPDLKARLEALAGQTGQTVADCLRSAVHDYIEAWESHLSNLDQIGDTEARAMLAPQLSEDGPAS